jgi:hypothetical protein
LPGTNTLAYLASSSATKGKGLKTLTPGLRSGRFFRLQNIGDLALPFFNYLERSIPPRDESIMFTRISVEFDAPNKDHEVDHDGRAADKNVRNSYVFQEEGDTFKVVDEVGQKES